MAVLSLPDPSLHALTFVVTRSKRTSTSFLSYSPNPFQRADSKGFVHPLSRMPLLKAYSLQRRIALSKSKGYAGLSVQIL
jgi:hypothetical protein